MPSATIRCHTPWVIAILATLHSACHAGRPLAVEDASVSPMGQCQVEVWLERNRTGNDANVAVLAPACGVSEGLELGLEFGTPAHSRHADQSRGLAVKWAPEAAQWAGWQLGAKASWGQSKPAGSGRWLEGTFTVLGMASRPLAADWTVHANLGVDAGGDPSDTTAQAGLALVWTPHEQCLWFLEMTANEHVPATRGAGMRYWLITDELGLDVTVSKTNAVRQSTTVTVGLGWYGLSF